MSGSKGAGPLIDRLDEAITLMGVVKALGNHSFTLSCRTDDEVEIDVGPETYFSVLTNVDGVDRDRTVPPTENAETVATSSSVLDEAASQEDASNSPPDPRITQYLAAEQLIIVRGVHQLARGTATDERMEARTVWVLQQALDEGYSFEATHWWIGQTTSLADRWLDTLFDENRDYSVEDFSRFYVTNLNITGQPTDDTIQECATLSRLIYGLSSAYLLTGADRYFRAASAAVSYQRQAFRSLTSDGDRCIWAHGRVKRTIGEELKFSSTFKDDFGTIPLYEQIYALAGLAQYYRITGDWEILEDIRRTMNAFDLFYKDPTEHGGYFSHIDAVSFNHSERSLGDNAAKKNWNSIGDHIPAYLINLILALDPLPNVGDTTFGDNEEDSIDDLRHRSIEMLKDLVGIIISRFFEKNEDMKYVNERFAQDWTPDHDYKWQKNRAIVGHNLKIAWNLTRCQFFFESYSSRLVQQRSARLKEISQLGSDEMNRREYLNRKVAAINAENEPLKGLIEGCRLHARKLGIDMATYGLDALRGGVFDAVERKPKNGMQIQFAWSTTKDFWQQEQGILAYLILCGASDVHDEENSNFLRLSRECMAFWNVFFLDRERQGIFFRTTEGGLPVIEAPYGQKGGHSISGYHVFELNYLAHIYIRSFFTAELTGDREFTLYFRVSPNRYQHTINVLPDFMPPNKLRIKKVRVNGVNRTQDMRRSPRQFDNFQLNLDDCHPSGTEHLHANEPIDIAVQFTAAPVEDEDN